MWQQYKKTAFGVQVLIACVSAVAWYTSRHWEAAAYFFTVMQVFAVFGAAWGVRLRGKVLGAGAVPTRRA